MKTYETFLEESLNQSHNWDWVVKSPSVWRGVFNHEDIEITVKLNKRSASFEPGDWEFVFGNYGVADQFTVTKKFGALSVFATVISMLKDFIKSISPRSLYFTGSKASGKGKLYKMFVKRFSNDIKNLGYEVERLNRPTELVFVFTKNKE